VYYVYGFMLLVSIILIIVTTCVTIVGTYFLLNAENYHWQWTAFLSGASTAGTLSLAFSLSLSLCHMPLRRLVATGVRSRNTR
jgi:NhaP-type Na+/H+ or K+/H+ antiporter